MPVGGREGARYVDLRFISKSRTIETYRAHDTKFGRDILLKVFRKAIAGSQARVQRLKQEIALVSRLQHHNVGQVYDYAQGEQLGYVAMEFIEGTPLVDFVRTYRLEPVETVSLLAQVADGLAAAHNGGLLHRDLKPNMLVVNPEGRMKIMDFGLGMFVGPMGKALTTRSGYLVGTEGYVPPEQLRGGNSSKSSDVFAAGVVFYEALTGQLPIRADALTLYALGDIAMELKVKPPSRINQQLDTKLDQIILKAIELEPDKRYQSGQELFDALEEWLQNQDRGRNLEELIANGPPPKEAEAEDDSDVVIAAAPAYRPSPEQRAPTTPSAKPEPQQPDDEPEELWISQVAILILIVAVAAPIFYATWSQKPAKPPTVVAVTQQPTQRPTLVTRRPTVTVSRPTQIAVRPTRKPTKSRPVKSGKSKLFQAVEAGDYGRVKSLVEQGEPINVADGSSNTPLHLAARSGSLQIFRTLLLGGANLDHKNLRGESPLAVAERYQHFNFVAIAVIHDMDLSFTEEENSSQWPPLCTAAWQGRADKIMSLLKSGENVNVKDTRGQTPLFIAALRGSLTATKVLLRKGAKVNVADSRGQTPLHMAAWHGHNNIVKQLLLKGANPSARDSRKATPLHSASRGGRTVAIKMLLKKAAKVDARDRDQQTPLMVAARVGHADVVGLLLKKGANVNLQDNRGRTAVDHAKFNGYVELASLLSKRIK